jgi:hypothetical protein
MKVKTFTGTDKGALDQQINNWLSRSNVKVQNTTTAFKNLREHGWDAIAGRTTSRRAVAIAISVWYDDPPPAQPNNWTFGPARKTSRRR